MTGLEVLIMQCAPGVSPQTMSAIIQVESAGNPWQIGNNTLKRPHKPTPRSYQEAVMVANHLISIGHNIDIGLAQINSKNLRMLNLSVEQVLVPCTNIAAGGKILRDFYTRASSKYGHGQQALYHALSGYNTGSLYAGAKYVRKIIMAAYKGAPANFVPVSTQQVSIPQPQYLQPHPTQYATVLQTYPNQILVDNSQENSILSK